MANENALVSPVSLISALCRICVTPTNAEYPIYNMGKQEAAVVSLHMKLSDLFPTIFNDEQATSDQAMNWPSKVCQECMRSATVAYDLYELSLKSTERLKKLLTEECNATTEVGDMKVEQVYLSDFVKTELPASDDAAYESVKASERCRKTLRNRKPVSPKERRVKLPRNILAQAKEHKKESAKNRQKLQSSDDIAPDNNVEVENVDETAECRNIGSDIEDISVGRTLDNRSSKKKRRELQQTKRRKLDVTGEALDCTEYEPDPMEEPQSKIDLYRCQLCDGPTYTSPSELTEHLKAVHPDQIRSCDQCPKVFMNEAAFQHHQYCHATKRSHFCTFCDKGFQTQALLKSHIRMHTHRADYLCSLCGKEFNNKSNLRQHVRRHTGDKPWACSQCPGRFTTKGGLTSHQHTHTKVKAFSCDTCGSQFNKHYSLIKHQLIHTGTRPYSCEVCAMRFTSTYHVKRHMRTHTGEKPFKCTYCERSFAQSNDMVKHMRMHLGDNPYQCDRCDASYRLLSDLRNHYKEHYQPGEKAPGISPAEDEKGIRFTSTDILKLRYRKEMAQGNVDGFEGNTEDAKARTEPTEYLVDP